MRKLLIMIVMVLAVIGMMPFALGHHESVALDSDSSEEVGDGSDVNDTFSDKMTDNRDVRSKNEKVNQRIRVDGKKIRDRIRKRLVAGGDLKDFNFEEIRAFQKEQLERAIDKCEKRGDSDKCESKLRKRINLIEKLGEKDLERIKKIKNIRIKHENEFENLKKERYFKKFKFEEKAREIRKEKKVEIRKRLEEIKRRFEDEKERFDDAKDDFSEIRERVRSCGNSETSECQEFQAEIKLKAKTFLDRALNQIENHLNKLKTIVEESETLSEREVTDALASIDEKLVKVDGLQEKVASITKDSSKEEIQKLSKEIRDLWKKDIKFVAEQRAGFVITSRLAGIIVKSEKLEAKLGRILERLAERGIDTSNTESLIDKFSSKIDDAKTNFEAAQVKYEEAVSLRGVAREDAIKEAKALVKKSKDFLKEAQNIIKEIVGELRDRDAENELEEDKSEEALEEVEDEDDDLKEGKFDVEDDKNKTEDDENELEVVDDDDDAEEDLNESVSLNDIPVAVRDTLLSEVGNGTVQEIEMEVEDEGTVYGAKALIDNLKWEIKVWENGSLIKKELD